MVSDWRVDRAHEPQRAWLEALHLHERADYHAKRYKDLVSKADAEGRPAALKAAAAAEARLETREKELAEANLNRRRRGRKDGRLRRLEQPPFTFSRPDGELARWINPYPPKGKVLPTRAGNAFRAMETFGSTNLGLDSQTMWNELLSVAPKPVGEATHDAELATDMMLAAYVSALAFTTASAWALAEVWARQAHRLDPSLLVCLGAGLLAVPVTYRGMTAAAQAWGDAVRAIVIMGREPLRRHLRLRVPTTTDEEKSLWEAVTGFANYGASYGPFLDPWRDTSPDRREGSEAADRE